MNKDEGGFTLEKIRNTGRVGRAGNFTQESVRGIGRLIMNRRF